MQYHRNDHPTKLLKRMSVSVAALFIAGMLAACGSNTAVGQTEPTTEGVPNATAVIAPTMTVDTSPMAESTPMAEGNGTMGNGTADNPLTVADVMQDPAAYAGQEVTIVGEAEQIFGAYGFKLDENSWLTAGIDNDLPVIGAAADTIAPDDTWINDQYLVTGTIRNYAQVDFECDYSWFTPGDEWTAQIDASQPVLIANSVQQVDADTFTSGLGDAGGVFDDTNAPAGTLAVADVTGSMDQYAGQQVTVQGEVQNVYNGSGTNASVNTNDSANDQALRLDDNSLLYGGIDNDLLVIGAAADTLANTQSLDEFGFDNTIVRVSGTVQNFSRAQIEQTIGYSLTDPIFDSWDGQPVLIADSIQTVGQQ